MQFFKSGDVYRVARITGVQDNFFAITLADHPAETEVIAFPLPDSALVRTSSHEVLKQVSEGLAEINQELGKCYCVGKVFFSPQENSGHAVYKFLISELIRKIDAGGIPEIG